jgi:deoxyribodipyrimidine photo-lyase
MSLPSIHNLGSGPTNALVWLRRDLRLHDHRPLEKAVQAGANVQHLFVFDTTILNRLTQKNDRRVEFIHDSLMELEANLNHYGGTLVVLHGDPAVLVPQFCKEHAITEVYAGRDVEPNAVLRDHVVFNLLTSQGLQWHLVDDNNVVPVDAVMQDGKKPYVVFTPYSRRWLMLLDHCIADASVLLNEVNWMKIARPVPSITSIGFCEAGNKQLGFIGGENGARAFWQDFKFRINQYNIRRDFPSVKGTSYLSMHFRFGTISPRQCVREVRALMSTNEGVMTWVKELAWRDFYSQLLYHFPFTTTSAFQTRYRDLEWNEDPGLLKAWKEGKTGYPMVDAAQRQILATGFMHNRLRMVTASFFTKHLGLDWRIGEAFFAEHLNDYDMASNVGGWQWASSVGSDAQPYFRVFNPMLQSQKFDKEGKFIRRYCPELAKVPNTFIHTPWLMSVEQQISSHCIIGEDYPAPIVDHKTARDEAVARFKKA